MKTLLLIDANSLVHRCFHALPPFTNKEGKPTGSLYGLASILIKILFNHDPAGEAGVSNEKIDYIAALFDRPEPTFRKEIFDDYKIQRPKAPDELVSQIIEAHNLFKAFDIKTFEVPGFEADDLIGAGVEKFRNEKDVKIIVLTGDLDDLQLVQDDKVLVETIKKGISETVIYNEAAVKERYGIEPNQLVDYKSLAGDVSDNIPGAPGIGHKTASQIISKYGSIENFFENGKDEKSYQKIIGYKDQVLLSKKLSQIRRDAPLEIKNLQEIERPTSDKEKIISYFDKMGFKSLAKRLE